MSSLVPVVFGLLVSVFALRVASQSPQNGLSTLLTPPPPLSPPPPPPGSPPPPSPFSPPPTPAPSSEKQHNLKNDSSRNRSAPPPRRQTKSGRHSPPPPPPPLRQRESKINVGKKIGLLFSGIAAILQIGVISFLVFKRRQLLKVTNRYETCS